MINIIYKSKFKWADTAVQDLPETETEIETIDETNSIKGIVLEIKDEAIAKVSSAGNKYYPFYNPS